MKLRMKKSCKGCAAARFNGSCSLLYSTKLQWMKSPWDGIRTFSKPLEICPKPRTIQQAVDMSIGNIPGKAGTLYVS